MGRTIRICSLLALLFVGTAADAKRMMPSALGLYARARVADGLQSGSADRYRAALTASPDTPAVAFRAYRAAVEAGDYPLALRAAQSLDRAGLVPPDAKVLLYVASVRDRDWNSAKTRLADIADEPGFGFLEPLFGGWLALAIGEPFSIREKQPTAYAAENGALILLARGETVEGSTAVRALWSTDPERAASLRIAAAATLAARKQREAALALLPRDSTAARALVERKARMPYAVDSPARGAAFILSRMASDLATERTTRSAITLARLATFADPDNPRIALAAADVLAAAKRNAAALDLTENVVRDPVYGPDATALRVDLLESLGRVDEALATARQLPGQSSRLGDIEARRGNPVQAAQHYRAAMASLGEGKIGWPLLLAAANALEMAGSWAEARPLLERALSLAPEEPRLLNQLGYGLADRGEELPRAFDLLRRANAAQPENAAITDSLGWAEFRCGRPEDAIPILERARVLDSAEPEIGEHLGDAYWTVGRRIEARHAWAAARETADGTVAERLSGKIDRGLP